MTLPPLVGAGSPGGPTGPRDPQTGRFVTRPTPQPQEAEREASRRPRRRARRETTPTPEDQVRSEPQVGGGQVATPPPPEPETRDRPSPVVTPTPTPPPEPETRDRPSPVVTPTPTPPPEPEPEVDREAESRAATLSGEPETPTTATGISVTKSPGPVTHTAQVAGFGPVLTTSGGPKPARSIFDKALDFVPIYGTIRHGRQVAANWENNSNAGRALDVGLLFLSALGDVVIVGGPTVGLTAKVVGKGSTAIRVTTNSLDEAVTLMRVGEADRVVLRAIAGSSDEIADQARAMLDAAPKPSKIKVDVSYKLTPSDITAAGSLDDALRAAGIRTRGAEIIASADDVARANPADIVNAVQKANIKSIKVRVEVPKVTQSGADTINAALKDLRAAGSGDRAGVLPGARVGAAPGDPAVPVDQLRKIMNVPTRSALEDAKAAAKVLERDLFGAGVGVEFRFGPSPKLKFKGRTITRELEYVHPQGSGGLADDLARVSPGSRGGAPLLTVTERSGVTLSRASAIAGGTKSVVFLNPLFVPDEAIPGVPESIPTRFPSETESPGGEPGRREADRPGEFPFPGPGPRRGDQPEDEDEPGARPDEVTKPDKTIRPSPGGEPVPKVAPKRDPTKRPARGSPGGEPVPKTPPVRTPPEEEEDKRKLKPQIIEVPEPGPGPGHEPQPEHKIEPEPGGEPSETTETKTETETETQTKTKAKVSVKGGAQQRVARRARSPRTFGPPADQAEDKQDIGPRSKTRRFPRTAVFKHGRTFITFDLKTGQATRSRKRPPGLRRRRSKGKGSTARTFAITAWDSDPPSERELELGAFTAVVGRSGVKFRRKRK